MQSSIGVTAQWQVVTTLGKLFTPICIRDQAVYIDSDVKTGLRQRWPGLTFEAALPTFLPLYKKWGSDGQNICVDWTLFKLGPDPWTPDILLPVLAMCGFERIGIYPLSTLWGRPVERPKTARESLERISSSPVVEVWGLCLSPRKCLTLVDRNGVFWCILRLVYGLKRPNCDTARTKRQHKTCLLTFG